MSRPKHLLCRHGWYYLRLRIPQDVQPFLSCHEVCKPLKTQDIKLARFLVVMYVAELGRMFTLIRTGLLNREQIQDIVRTSCLARLAFFEERRDAGDRAYVDSVRLPVLEADIRKTKTALAELDFQSYGDQVKALIKEHGHLRRVRVWF